MTDKRTEKRAEKKSETLEVRLPHSKKEAFKAACEEEGITASHAVRTFIDAYLKRSRRVKLKRIAEEITMKLFRNPIKAAGIAGTGIIAAILFSASPSAAEDDPFAYLDQNGDGFISAEDSDFVAEMFSGRDGPGLNLKSADTNGDNRLNREEFSSLDTFLATVDTPVKIEGGPDVKTLYLIAPETGGPSDLGVSAEAIQKALESGNIEFSTDGAEPGTNSTKGRIIIQTETPPSKPE